MSEDTKPWYTSKTIWGAVIAGFAPLAGRLLGTQVDPALADALATVLAGVGAAVAVHGRVTATKPITSGKV